MIKDTVSKFFPLFSLAIIMAIPFASEASSCKRKDLASFKQSSSTVKERKTFYKCFHKKEIYSVSMPGLIKLIVDTRKPELQDSLVKTVLENVPRKYELFLYKKLYNKRLQLTPKTKSDLMYFFALNSFDRGKIKSALYYLSKQAGVDFDRYAQSKFLKAVILTKLGKIDSAEAEFNELSKGLFKGVSSDVRAKIIGVSTLNVARINIEQEEYKDAIENYRNVSYKNDQWFDGLVEMSWAMLSRSDYEGAIGNAGFINQSTSPYIYKPWLPVIEAVGLLKICQFPDSKKSIDHFKKKYSTARKTTVAHIKKNSDKSWYEYSSQILGTTLNKTTVKTTPPLLFYAAKSENVVGHQKNLNELIDEESALKKMKRSLRKYKSSEAYGLIASRLKTINKNILKTQKEMGNVFKIKTAELLREFKELQKIVDVVGFEVFSRSSQNITMRVAGEKFNDKMKKAGRDESAWKYNGEFWTDEVGRFRSFLKNKCADES